MDSDTLLNELRQYTSIVFFEQNNEDVQKFIQSIPGESGCCIDVSVSPDLRDAVINAYKIDKFPVLVYRGKSIYETENIYDKIDAIEKQNILSAKDFLDSFVLKKGVTIFIKGTIENPYCKFSKQLLACMTEASISDVKCFNIFTNDHLRHYMKIINDWPTFPMIYINGTFIGGLDVFKELVNNGKVNEMLNKSD